MSDDKTFSLAPSLSSTIAERGAADILVDAGELALDAALEDGILKKVPVVG
jgi:hypothetical protein